MLDILRGEAGPIVIREPGSNVIGVAVGGAGDGPITQVGSDGFCIVAYVARLRPNAVAARERVQAACWEAGRKVGISVEPREVKVVEVGDIFRANAYTGSEHGKPAIANTQKWFKALRPGIGIANAYGYPDELSAGTVGFFVENGETQYLVSCNHVIARTNQGNPGEPIVQPATLDLSGGDLSDNSASDIQRRFLVARLTDFHKIEPDDPNASPPPSNLVDVALAELTESGTRERALRRLPYGGRLSGKADPYEVDDNGTIVGSSQVYKAGRTTGFTEGYVAELAGTYQVDYGGWTATFVDQLGVCRTVDNTGVAFSDAGDSGSALLTEEHKIAGLVFAASPGRSVANPIDAVIAALQGLVGTVTMIPP
jgi:hypothetical protein